MNFCMRNCMGPKLEALKMYTQQLNEIAKFEMNDVRTFLNVRLKFDKIFGKSNIMMSMTSVKWFIWIALLFWLLSFIIESCLHFHLWANKNGWINITSCMSLRDFHKLTWFHRCFCTFPSIKIKKIFILFVNSFWIAYEAQIKYVLSDYNSFLMMKPNQRNISIYKIVAFVQNSSQKINFQ